MQHAPSRSRLGVAQVPWPKSPQSWSASPARAFLADQTIVSVTEARREPRSTFLFWRPGRNISPDLIESQPIPSTEYVLALLICRRNDRSGGVTARDQSSGPARRLI